jgi:hypothetical protein
MIIAHEAPLKLIPLVQSITDYDYALAHHCLASYGAEYKEYFKNRAPGRELMLDNSAFELGDSIDPDIYFDLIAELNPTYFILPDKPDDIGATLNGAYKMLRRVDKLPNSKTVGVTQGKTSQELLNCAHELVELGVDIIAFPHARSAFAALHPEVPGLLAYALGRVDVVRRFIDSHGTIPIHLLGCTLPFECMFYKDRYYLSIQSVDTSSPIVSAIEGVAWNPLYGIDHKPNTTLDSIFQYDPYRFFVAVDRGLEQILINNVKIFQSFC